MSIRITNSVVTHERAARVVDERLGRALAEKTHACSSIVDVLEILAEAFESHAGSVPILSGIDTLRFALDPSCMRQGFLSVIGIQIVASKVFRRENREDFVAYLGCSANFRIEARLFAENSLRLRTFPMNDSRAD